jgi:hypothetical protein
MLAVIVLLVGLVSEQSLPCVSKVANSGRPSIRPALGG